MAPSSTGLGRKTFNLVNSGSIPSGAAMRPFFKDGHWVLTGGQKLINVHSEKACKGVHCTIHNPSNHHMVNWPQHYRVDRRMMERICPDHGIGHPDPDDPTTDTVHGCDGCCRPDAPNQFDADV